VRYVEDVTINEDTLFCTLIKRRATAKKKNFKIAGDFLKEESVKWSDCVGVCTDAAHVMAGNKEKTAGLNQTIGTRSYVDTLYDTS
jgi:hypothetical protein